MADAEPRLARVFRERKGQGALVAYITAGDPSLEETERLVPALARAGADVVELGLPFSDPLLDGVSIQASAHRALERGTTPDGVLEVAARLRAGGLETPLVLMTCTNLVARRGYGAFASRCAEAGVDGVIVTDMPPEESGEWRAAAAARGLDTIFLLAPTSDATRIAAVARLATGFIYCVSRAGVTGVQKDVPPDLHALLERIHAATDTPVCVGFGVSDASHVRTIWRWAEGAVVGSAIVNVIAEHAGRPDLIERTEAFVRALKPRHDLRGEGA